MATLRNGELIDYTKNRRCSSIVTCRCGRKGTPVEIRDYRGVLGAVVVHVAIVQDGRIDPIDYCWS